MTWPATSPGAALRVLRIAAGRRALQLVLLLGGLFAIGFLCGGQASAADRVSAPGVAAAGVSVGTSSASSAYLRSSTEGAVEGLGGAPAKHDVHDESTAPTKPADPRDGEGQVLRPVPEHATQAVGTHVVQPVGDVVESVTEELAGELAEVQAKAPPLATLPAVPSVPSVPSVPAVPSVPSVPSLPSLPPLPALPSMPVAPESPSWPSWPGLELPEFPGFPGTGLPAFPELPAVPGQTLPAPVTGAPQPGFEAPESGAGRDDEGRTGKEAAVAYGPRFVAGTDVTASHAPASSGTHSSAPSRYAPVQQAPVERPRGVQGNRSAGDSGTPRHGDAHAVSLNPRAPLRLVPGAAARVEADEIQDRHRDIPVSPA